MKLPHFPKPLARLVSSLPTWPASRAFAAAGNLAAWPSLRELDWSHVSGRRFCVHVRDLGLKLYFSLQGDGFHAEKNGLADVTFTATAQDFARLALRLEDPDTLFFNRRLLIEGDTDLGLTVKNMLDAVELETAAAGMPVGMGRVVMKLRGMALHV
jgi:predicted lipid carrier protein YhbT